MELGIRTCTAAIESGKPSAVGLANTLLSQGHAYYRKGVYDPSFGDYNQSIRLKPDYDDAFNGPGNAHFYKDEFDRAIQESFALQRRGGVQLRQEE